MGEQRTLIGVVTFGNLYFTMLTIHSIQQTTRSPIEFFVVVAKPGDAATASWLTVNKIPHKIHEINQGFPASINDICDWAWQHWNFDNLILAGNDIVPYSGALDALIDHANATDFEWIASSMFDVQSLIRMYPEQAKYFRGETFEFTQFDTQAPWKIHEPVVAATAPGVETNPNGPALIKDVRNLCLFKRSVFDKLGYADANFWPGGYFEDNDYARRAVNAGIKSCALTHSQYFHFWSRTIHQGTEQSGSQETKSRRAACFDRNEAFYRTKWGGAFAQERFSVPFNGQRFFLDGPIKLPASLKIPNRSEESAIIEYWSTR